ncbi:permease [Thermosulfidibacter takaii ABI70S6]|uniref:Permease n=1 Tax=Thermosulfidibacter takaii (strain DSM 17441 / JCM 13301 / NBRC 103674 / ABI70S6) TaxID=1298851 RepID=A0A0S3QRU1_THET7|nr:permease [Thermosulfidibacter takaii]BAT71058.1 permease [Thermosulfidibacter takaii ABI70S6]
MDLKREIKILVTALLVFLSLFYLPAQDRVLMGVREAVLLAHWYAKEHVIFCLIPAFFIAGAIAAFLSQESVMKYLGPKAPKPVAYSVAAVSGTILAVCSCTVLPLFASIYMNGAGLGPATTFLYSGPAINILAIVLTARVLGLKLGVARAVGAVGASILIGLLMSILFKKEDEERLSAFETGEVPESRPLWQNVFFLATLVAILIFATWGRGIGIWQKIYEIKWWLVLVSFVALELELYLFFGISPGWLVATLVVVGVFEMVFSGHEIPFLAAVIILSVALYRRGGEAREWFEHSYILGKQILPLLFAGVLAAGFFLGRPGHEGFIPAKFVTELVGSNSILSNLFASIVGAFMYFATLTEVPILQGLLGSGMHYGPALALLLSGPAVSLPNMLVINSVLGPKKTFAYVALVVIISTILGFLFGRWLYA